MKKLLSDKKLDYRILVMPEWKKDCWLNCAKVLIKIGYPDIKDVLDGLFEWIQDMNWPGSKLVFRYLKTLPKNVFMCHYQKAIREALKQNDDTWLYYLTLFMEPFALSINDFSDPNLYAVMCKDY